MRDALTSQTSTSTQIVAINSIPIVDGDHLKALVAANSSDVMEVVVEWPDASPRCRPPNRMGGTFGDFTASYLKGAIATAHTAATMGEKDLESRRVMLLSGLSFSNYTRAILVLQIGSQGMHRLLTFLHLFQGGASLRTHTHRNHLMLFWFRDMFAELLSSYARHQTDPLLVGAASKLSELLLEGQDADSMRDALTSYSYELVIHYMESGGRPIQLVPPAAVLTRRCGDEWEGVSKFGKGEYAVQIGDTRHAVLMANDCIDVKGVLEDPSVFRAVIRWEFVL